MRRLILIIAMLVLMLSETSFAYQFESFEWGKSVEETKNLVLDKDGLKNFKDCKPFDIKRQGKEHDEEKSKDLKVRNYGLQPGERFLSQEEWAERKKDFSKE